MSGSPSRLAPDRQIHDLAAFYALGTLDAVDHAAFEQHLQDGCASCEAELRVFRDVAAHIGAQAEAKRAAPLRDRLLSGLRTHPEAGTGLMDRAGMLFRCSADLPWKALAPGLSLKPLFVDHERQYVTAMVRVDPGTACPSHRHHDAEEIFVISGDLELAGQSMRAGDYCRAEAGTVHPTASSRAGCLFLLSASQLDEVIT